MVIEFRNSKVKNILFNSEILNGTAVHYKLEIDFLKKFLSLFFFLFFFNFNFILFFLMANLLIEIF